jgi:rubrerythrin
VTSKIYSNAFLQPIDLVKSTAENIESVMTSEMNDVENVYTEFIQKAKEEAQSEVMRSFMFIKAAKKKNIKLFETAYSGLNENTPVEYKLCSTCGYICKDNESVNCPICGKGLNSIPI